LLHTSYNRIRRYARGDPFNLCRFDRPGNLQLEKYREDIIEHIRQNVQRKDILATITILGYTGKRTALYEYCNKLIDEYRIPYTPKKNINGIAIKAKQKNDIHYLTRQEVFENLWSDKELAKKDIEYLYEKYPVLQEIKACIQKFREIYQRKDPELLNEFIKTYSKEDSKNKNPNLASFANGLKMDIDAVRNSVISELSNGFVEGINNKVKVIKRSMYGRAGLKLLGVKLIYIR
jgi:transposase